MKKKRTDSTSQTNTLSIPEALSAFVHTACVVLVLQSLGMWLRLVELATFETFTPLFIGVGGLCLSVLWWRPLDSALVHLVRRFCVVLCLICAGPLWLFSYGKSPGFPASLDYFILVAIISFMVGPDFLIIKNFVQGLMRGEDEKLSSSALPLRPWLVTFFLVSVTLCLVPVMTPYNGRLGGHVLLAAVWSLWIIPRQSFAESKFRWLARFLPALVLVTVFFFRFAWPWPHVFYGNEIIYSDFVAGQAVTLHAWKSETGTVYALTTEKSVLHTTTTAYRQAEILVHPAANIRKNKPKNILLLGSEDGAVLQELARYKHKKEVVWVPLFPFWRDFFSQAPLLSRNLAYDHTHTDVHRLNAMPSMSTVGLQLVMEEVGKGKFDLIIADFPGAGPKNQELFSQESNKILLSMLRPDGVLALNLASPYTQSALYWCLVARWAKIGAHVVPFQLAPSMYNDLGLVLVSKQPLHPFQKMLNIPVPTRYFYKTQPFSTIARFAKDTYPDGRAMTKSCSFK